MHKLFYYFAAPIQYRSLFAQFLRRDVLGRYRGSVLGIGWAFINPVLMLGVYTFVFVEVFKARWPGTDNAGGFDFSLRLFTGLIIYNFFNEVITRSPTLVSEQANLVKKVAFPLELLPMVSIGSALFQLLLSTFFLVLFVALQNGYINWGLLLFPIAIIPIIPLLLGLSLFLSAIGVFIRDTASITNVVANLLLFMSPVFYSPESLPKEWQFWINLNPLTPIIENTRNFIFLDRAPDWVNWIFSMMTACLIAVLGAWTFYRTRDGFADVL